MHTRSLGCGLGALAVAFTVSACGGPMAGGSPVSIRTFEPHDGLYDCYTMGVSGSLVTDSTAGTAIIDDMTGGRVIVTWPRGWTGRSSGSEVDIVNRRGHTTYRTGTHVDLSGGFSFVGSRPDRRRSETATRRYAAPPARQASPRAQCPGCGSHDRRSTDREPDPSLSVTWGQWYRRGRRTTRA
jgi:hypothetical protein